MKRYLTSLNSFLSIISILYCFLVYPQTNSSVKVRLTVYDQPCIDCAFELIASDQVVLKGKTDYKGDVLIENNLWNSFTKIKLNLDFFKSEIDRQIYSKKEDYIIYNFTDIKDEILEEIVILASKKTIEDYGYKTVYNVDKDHAVTALSATDLVRKIPGVTVNFDGTPIIRSSSNILVKLNDKVIRNMDAKTVLSTISPSDITKIVVELSPSVKDGGAAEYILAIYTRKSIYLGKSGYVNLGIGDKGNHLFANYNTLLGKKIQFNQSLSALTYNNKQSFQSKLNEWKTNGVGKSKGLLLNYYGNFNFILDEESTLDLSFQLLHKSIKNEEEMSAKNSKVEYESKNKLSYGNTSLYYVKKKELTTIELTADVGSMGLGFDTQRDDEVGCNSIDIISTSIKGDYSHKFSRTYEIEGGGNIQYDFLKGKAGTDQTNFEADKVMSSVYLNNKVNLSSLSLEFGVGYATYFYKWKQKVSTQDLFYTARGNYRINIANTIYTLYNKNIINPANTYLVPTFFLRSPMIWEQGNPNLKPVVSNKLELGYSLKAERFFFKTAVFYSHNKHVITTSLSENTLSYLNKGNNQNLGISNWITTHFFNSRLAVNYGVDFIYKSLKSGKEQSDGYVLKNNIHLTFELTEGLEVQFFGNFNSPDILLYGKENSFTYSNFSVQKKLASKKAILAFSIDNPFSKSFKYKNEITTSFGNYEREVWFRNRGVRIFFAYQFGKEDTAQKTNYSNDLRTF